MFSFQSQVSEPAIDAAVGLRGRGRIAVMSYAMARMTPSSPGLVDNHDLLLTLAGQPS